MSVQLHVETSGSGPPVVFSHGAGSSADAWRHQVAAVAEQAGHTAVAWDLRGHARSERPPSASDYSLGHALGDLEAVIGGIDGSGPGGGAAPVLAGHSFGGYLSLAYTIRHPHDVRALFLVASGPGFRDPEARGRWNVNALAGSERLALPEAVLHIMVQDDDHVIAGLPGIEVLAVVVVGERDRAFRGAADYMAAKLPRARLVLVEGAGHGVHETHPEPVNEALLELLTETAPPTT